MSIKTVLNREDALKLLDLGETFFNESRFKNETFDRERCWTVLQKVSMYPAHYFIAYDDQFRGFILMVKTENFFSGEVTVQDMSFYVTPQARGGFLAVRLEKAARQWAKEVGAKQMIIYHNTGINTEHSPALFTKLGYNKQGYIFSREL